MQRFPDLALRHVHDVGICEFASLSLGFKCLDAVKEISVYTMS